MRKNFKLSKLLINAILFSSVTFLGITKTQAMHAAPRIQMNNGSVHRLSPEESIQSNNEQFAKQHTIEKIIDLINACGNKELTFNEEELNKKIEEVEKTIKTMQINDETVDRTIDRTKIPNKEEIKETVKILLLEAGGGYSLDDHVRYLEENYFEGSLGIKNGKMNDSSIISAYLLAVRLTLYRLYGTMFPEKDAKILPLEEQPKIFTILGSKPDNSIKIPEEVKEYADHLIYYLLSDINPVEATGEQTKNEEIKKHIENEYKGKRTLNDLTYLIYPGASSYHNASVNAKNNIVSDCIKKGLHAPDFYRVSVQTDDAPGKKGQGPTYMMYESEKEHMQRLVQDFLHEFLFYMYPELPTKISENSNENVPIEILVIDNPKLGRWVPRTSKEGIHTMTDWHEHTDNPKVQASLFDEERVNQTATLKAVSLLRFFRENPRFAYIALEPATINGKLGIRFIIDVTGKKLNDLEEGSVIISRADLPDEKFEYRGKFTKIDDKTYRLGDKEMNLDEKMDWNKEINNEYYIKVYVKNSNGTTERLPSTVNSFKLKPEDIRYMDKGLICTKRNENKIVAEINTVTQKELQDKLKKQKMQSVNTTELTDKSKSADKTELTDKNKAADKTELTDKNKAADKTELTDKSKAADKTELTDKNKAADKTELTDKSKSADKTELTDKSKSDDKTELTDKK